MATNRLKILTGARGSAFGWSGTNEGTIGQAASIILNRKFSPRAFFIKDLLGGFLRTVAVIIILRILLRSP